MKQESKQRRNLRGKKQSPNAVPNQIADLAGKTDKASERLDLLNRQIAEDLERLKKTRNGKRCYAFLLYSTNISHIVVDDVFDDLRKNYQGCNDELDVLVFSSGGDIDAAYNLALLFRRYANRDLTFIVSRWAKSAATLLVCAGNKILMSPVAELGPLDPQITQVNPLEQRLERFSPLHIEATLNLIRDEFSKGDEKLAKGLLERLQFPLTLGSFKKSLDVGKEYATRLLSTRMLTGSGRETKAKEIAEKLTSGYADHSFCIDIDEAKKIGLAVEQLDETQLDIVWNIHKACREKDEIKTSQKRKQLEKLLKNLPPELREILSEDDTTGPPSRP